MNNESNLNLYEVTTNRLQKVKAGHFVFSVWRGKTAYKDDVIKCFNVDDDPRYENRFDLVHVKPLWIEKKNLKYVRSLSKEEIKQLNDNNLLGYENAEDILIYGLFQKETDKAIFVLFANDKPCWIAKSQINNKKVYDLDGRKDICFEIPRWIAEDKLGKEVTNKFSDAKDIISKRLSALTTKFNMGGLNV